jgi:hypothetical protein
VVCFQYLADDQVADVDAIMRMYTRALAEMKSPDGSWRNSTSAVGSPAYD